MSPTRFTPRRRALVLSVLALPLSRFSAAAAARPQVDVWKSPTCGCCKEWVAHLQANGFEVRTFETGNAQARRHFGVPMALASCHTARVEGYVIEGHVPAREIQRLLAEKPDALGLAVPAMPIGSPGMDGPEYNGRRDPYDVLLIAKDGGTSVFQSYR